MLWCANAHRPPGNWPTKPRWRRSKRYLPQGVVDQVCQTRSRERRLTAGDVAGICLVLACPKHRVCPGAHGQCMSKLLRKLGALVDPATVTYNSWRRAEIGSVAWDESAAAQHPQFQCQCAKHSPTPVSARER